MLKEENRLFRVCMIFHFNAISNKLLFSDIEVLSTYLGRFNYGITLVAISSENRNDLHKNLPENVKTYIFPVKHFLPPFSRFTRLFNGIINTFWQVMSLWRMVNRGKYDIVIIRNELNPRLSDVVIAWYVKKRKVHSLVLDLPNPLGQGPEDFGRDTPQPKFIYHMIAWMRRRMNSFLIYKADLIVTFGKWQQERLIEAGVTREKLLQIPAGVDMDKFSVNNEITIIEKYNLQESRILLYLGIMQETRKIEVLIKAFELVRSKISNVKLLMVGDGKHRKYLEVLADDLGLAEDVIFTGRVPEFPRSEVPDYIAVAEIGLSPVPPLPFYMYSSPIKMVEYMAMGKPVVANEEIPEQEEVIRESQGGILVPFSPEGFANGIIQLLENPLEAREMGRKGREWVISNRSYAVLASQVMQRYQELVSH